MQAVFLRQIVLDRGGFFFAKNPVVNQNFADLPIGRRLINSFANRARAGDAAEYRPLTPLPEHP